MKYLKMNKGINDPFLAPGAGPLVASSRFATCNVNAAYDPFLAPGFTLVAPYQVCHL